MSSSDHRRDSADVEAIDVDASAPFADDAGARYVEGELIGKGGLGEVIEAFDVDLRRTVALKRLRADRDREQDGARLITEAQITAQLEHPNIPPVHSLGFSEDGRPYFTMTLVRGTSLSDVIARAHAGPGPWQEVGLGQMLRIFLRVAYALAAAHARGVIHRDLKPDNIMVGAFGEVRLMDWGIAKNVGQRDDELGGRSAMHDSSGSLEAPPIDLSEEPPKSLVGTVIGTPGYMSPEQAAGRRDIDRRADLYALGATLYEMLSGQPAVDATSNLEKLQHTVDGTIIPLSEYPWVPAPLIAIVHKAMATSRDDRYQTAIDLIVDLESFLEGRPVEARSEGFLTRLGRYYTSRPPRSMRLRFIDVDTLAASSLLLGAAIGALTSQWIEGWEWLLIIAGILIGVPFYRTWFRRARYDDPTSHLLRPEPITPTTEPERPSGSRTTKRAIPASDLEDADTLADDPAHATTLAPEVAAPASGRDGDGDESDGPARRKSS